MKMTSIMRGALIASCALPITLAFPAMAQENGESRCGADGYVERYTSYNHSWSSSLLHCAGGGGRSQSEDHHGGGGGEPEDGDTKCGADGKVYTYFAGSHHWGGGIANCH